MNEYCDCNNPDHEEIKRGVVICLNCNREVLQTEDYPEPDPDEMANNEIEENLERNAGI